LCYVSAIATQIFTPFLAKFGEFVLASNREQTCQMMGSKDSFTDKASAFLFAVMAHIERIS
jgi:hypothetical protein